MPTEAELRTWLREGDLGSPTREADTGSVIRRSRRRRLPRQLAAGGTLTLAIAGIGVAGFTGLRTMPMGASVSDAGAESAPEVFSGQDAGEAASGGAIQAAPASKLNPCGGGMADVAPSAGLVLETRFAPSAPADGQSVDGTVTLTNTGTERIVGTTAATPAITLSQGGKVLWHSNGPMIMMVVEVDLAPGESLDYPASFTAVQCAEEDEMSESFRDDLPALGAGNYDLSAAIDLLGADGSPMPTITGPLSRITLE